jgi:tetratricopeptide (TPR) repeat protein
VIEPFPARGEHAVNVHETTRLTLREHLRMSDAALWETLSTRSRAHVVQSHEPHARIEALYHLFATDQAAAAAECEALDREFSSGGRLEVRYALAIALRELTGERLVSADPSNAGWQRERAVAHSKVGDIYQEQGHLDDALAAYRECLAIFQRLASTDPSNAGWQSDLAFAHNK